jgi:parallel beta-helix repeat protein
VLTRDIGPCMGDGLRIGAKVVLDGAGHAIRGLGARGSVGLSVGEKGEGTRVQRLEVTGFERGVRLRGTSRVELSEIESHQNGDPVAHVGYGIDLADGASSNVIDRCRVHGNADEGIHIGSHAAGNRISDSEIFDNHRENVYLLATIDTVISGSRIHGGGSSAVFVKNSRGAVVKRNRIADRPLTVRGASLGVQAIDNTLVESGVRVEAYDDRALGPVHPKKTVVRGGSITSALPCVHVEGAEETTIDGVDLKCPKSVAVSGGSAVSVVGARLAAIGCAGPGSVREMRRVDFRVRSAGGQPVPRARIESEVSPAADAGGVADDAGRFEGLVVDSVTSCPGGKVEKLNGFVVSAGDRTRRVAWSELGHEVILPDKRSAAANGQGE